MVLVPNDTGLAIKDYEYAMFSRRVQALTGLDLNSYKSEQMRRRLGSLAARVGAGSLAEYARLIEHDERRLQEFKDFLTINVTEFFRDPERFVALADMLAAHRRRGAPRIWSAGCSTGAEPYSLAILLDELGVLDRSVIVATDLDESALARAREGGPFRENEVRNVSAERRRRYLQRHGDHYFVVDRLRRVPRFGRHNLLGPPPDAEFDYVLCRNVVIYFTDIAKDAVFSRLATVLAPGGTLLVGGTEMIGNASGLGLMAKGNSFYLKNERRQELGR